MNYIELDLKVDPEFSEILMAELGEAGFESFVETDEGLLAYIQEADFDENAVRDLTAKYLDLTTIAATWKSLERRNWNEEWEKSYEPIEVGRALNERGIAVRAGHHCAQPILRRLGYEATVRPSLAFYNTCEEIDVLVEELHRLAAERGNRRAR